MPHRIELHLRWTAECCSIQDGKYQHWVMCYSLHLNPKYVAPKVTTVAVLAFFVITISARQLCSFTAKLYLFTSARAHKGVGLFLWGVPFHCIRANASETFLLSHDCRSSQDGNTNLLAAAQNGHLEVVRLLLEHKADIHLANKVLCSRASPTPSPSQWQKQFDHILSRSLLRKPSQALKPHWTSIDSDGSSSSSLAAFIALYHDTQFNQKIKYLEWNDWFSVLRPPLTWETENLSDREQLRREESGVCVWGGWVRERRASVC